MKRLITILGFVLITIGCSELLQDNEYYPLPENYKTELEVFDTLIFENEKLQIDSFVVMNIIKGNIQYALSGTSSKEPYAFHEFEYIMISKIDDPDDSFRIKQMISQGDGNYGEGTRPLITDYDSLMICIRIGTRGRTNNGVEKDFHPIINWYSQRYFSMVENHDILTIGQKEYYNTIELEFDYGIKRIFYDYKLGIIKFIDSNGAVWLRIN